MFRKLRPYNLLGIAGLLLFAISFIAPNQNADIHFHDRFYVFDMSFAYRNMACLLLVIFTVYTFLKQKLYSVILCWIHAGLTILAILLGIWFLYNASKAYQPNFSAWTTFEKNNDFIVVTLAIFLLAQALLVINLMIGAFKKQIIKS